MKLLLSALAASAALSHAADSWKLTTSKNPVQNGPGYSLINYKGDIIVTGNFDSTRFTGQPSIMTRNVARWNGKDWDGMGKGVKAAYEVFASAVYKDNLYVGGDRLDSAGEAKITNNVAMWNGSEWSAVGTGATDIGMVYSLCEYKGELYVGGKLGLNKWDGSKWTNVFSAAKDAAVHALKVYKDELYVGGTFTQFGGAAHQNLVRWNGSAWSGVGGGILANMFIANLVINKAKVTVMAEFQGDLYVGGEIDSVGGFKAKGLVRWNGSAWSGEVAGGVNSTVMALLPRGNSLYVAGYFWKVGSPEVSSNRAAAWNGTSWTPMTSLTGGNAMAVRNDTLFALGSQDVQYWTGAIEAGGSVAVAEAPSRAGLEAEYFPAARRLLVRSPGVRSADAEIFDLQGRPHGRMPLRGGSAALDIGHLANGRYYLKVEGPAGAWVRSFIKY